MNVLITGAAGFIGFSLAKLLLEDTTSAYTIIGIDNHNDYYAPKLKADRVNILKSYQNYHHHILDIKDYEDLANVFEKYQPEVVINLAAQAGVRYSLENPQAYVNSNLVGFVNILECCRKAKIKHLIFASSSSVYGANTNLPSAETDTTDHQISLYGATKKSNEVISHAYSSIYGLPITGLRFFTVYGPWGRPDMAFFKFTNNILSGKPIDVYNNGEHVRDFTYIDDIVFAIKLLISKPPVENSAWDASNRILGSSFAPWQIFNIGNNQPVELMRYIEVIENCAKKKAKINFLAMQPGDVHATHADTRKLTEKINFMPQTTIEVGMANFVRWFKEYYNC